jgi:hypothetical protein
MQFLSGLLCLFRKAFKQRVINLHGEGYCFKKLVRNLSFYLSVPCITEISMHSECVFAHGEGLTLMCS